MTFKELRKIVTRHAGWEAYRTENGIASASDLSKADLEQIASHLNIALDGVTPAEADPVEADPAEVPAEATPTGTPDPLASLRPVLAASMLAEADQAISAVVADLQQARADAQAARDAAAHAAQAAPVATTGDRATVNPGSPAGPRPFSDVIGGRKHSFPVATFQGADRVPAVDQDYIWPDRTPFLVRVLEGSEFSRRHVMLFGPRGTGKTSFAEQYAAKTGRPFFAIAFDDDFSFDRAFGFPAPEGEGMAWHMGELMAAFTVPNAVVALEEIGASRPSLMTPLQTLLQTGFVNLPQGHVARVAPGVRFIATNNNNGAELSAGGYHGLRPMNEALRDRFAMMCEIPYLTPAREAAALVKRTGVSVELARAMCDFAAKTRKADADMATTVGFRRLLAWADAMAAFPEDSAAVFDMTVREGFGEDDRAVLDRLVDTDLDHDTLTRLAKGEAPADPAPAETRHGFTRVDFAGPSA